MFRRSNFKFSWKYALGELVLIFLGISLAIWFNNWNELRKAEKQRITLLQNLKEDVLLDIENFNNMVGFHKNQRKQADMILDYLTNFPGEIDTMETATALIQIGWINQYSPSFATYNEMMGSGKLVLIKSIELKKEMARYKSQVEDFLKVESTIYRHNSEYNLKLFGYFGDELSIPDSVFIDGRYRLENIKFDLNQIAMDNEIINYIKLFRFFTYGKIGNKQVVDIPNAERLVDLIDEALTR